MQSSACSRQVESKCCEMSLIKSRNNRGPNTEPYGTPLKTFEGSEMQPPQITLCVLPVRKDETQFKVSPLVP